MKEYDVIIVGSGAGLDILDVAVQHGLKTALAEHGPAGGTCLNVGCIPSKMLIFPADRVMEIQEALSVGVKARVESIDFDFIMQRMRRVVDPDREGIKRHLEKSKDFEYYAARAEFVAPYQLKVGAETITAKKIFLASGTRPLIPDLAGLDSVPYLTSETLLNLEKLPASLVIIGGGYIGVEYAHFFQAMGTTVTILEMGPNLVPGEDPEISALLQVSLARRMKVLTGARAVLVTPGEPGVFIQIVHAATGQRETISAEKLLVAAGRRSNADILKAELGGIALDEKGFFKVDSHLETNIKGIYGIGDANGREMFTHTAHAEAAVAAANGIHSRSETMDYRAAPHAIFTHPQVASVGLTEAAAGLKHNIRVGRAGYADIALGSAMGQREGFAKIILDRQTDKLLGCHIIGPWASVVIQEAINAMARGGGADDIARGIHIHPALSELVIKALNNAYETE
jgi:dihydrolipoamide dehydrogenase